MVPADAATPRIGGPCKKLHQVDWIKGVRAQCTWIPAGQGKKGRSVWKALAPAKTTATAGELGVIPSLPTVDTGTATDTSTAVVPVETGTAVPSMETATAK